MKKSKLLSVLFLLITTGLFAEDVDFNWFSELRPSYEGSKPTSSMNYSQANSEGDLFMLGHFGSNPDYSLDATFMGSTYTGATYGGNSYNQNFILTKSDFSGNVEWSVYSDQGDFTASSSSAMTPTSDGGCFMALKIRHTKSVDSTYMIRLISSTGDKDSLLWHAQSFTSDGEYHWCYQGALLKMSADGDIEYLKLLPVDLSPAESASSYYSTYTPDGFYFYGAAQDTKGNYYIGGQLRQKMAFGSDTIKPHNVSSWNGDSQKTVGNAFVVKLNQNFEYVSHFETTGTATYDNVKRMEIEGDNLYIVGNVYGTGSDNDSIGSYGFTPVAYNSAYTAKLDLDLNVQWAKYYPFVKTQSSKDLKIYNLEVDNDTLYFAGGIRGGIAVDENTPTTAIIESGGCVLNGYVMQCSASDGTVLNAAIRSSSAIGLSWGIIATDDSVFVYGYDWASYDLILDSYDKNLTLNNSYSLVKDAFYSTAWDMTANRDTLVILGRGRYFSASHSYEIFGADTALNRKGYTGFAASWTFPGRNFTPRITPEITWEAPVSITYGTAIDSSILCAKSNVDGTFAYNLSFDTILDVTDSVELITAFTPTDLDNCVSVNDTVYLKINKAPLIIAANDTNCVIGESIPEFTVTYSGFVNNEDTSVLDNLPTITCAATAESEVGRYDIVVSCENDNNYDITCTNGKFYITAKTMPNVVWNTPVDITYGTAIDSTQLNATADINGKFVYNLTVDTLLDAGELIPLALEFTPNDTVNYVSVIDTVYINIDKAVLSVVVNDTVCKEGESVSEFTITYSGFVNDEDISVIDTLPSATCSATTESEAGTYDIILSGGADNNYEMSYTNGTLTISAGSGVNDNFIQNVAIYPNPVSDMLTISLGETTENVTYRLMSLTGNIVDAGIMNNGYSTINVSNMESGIYILQIQDGANSMIRKIVKQ